MSDKITIDIKNIEIIVNRSTIKDIEYSNSTKIDLSRKVIIDNCIYVDENTITPLEVNRKIKLLKVNYPSLFKYHQFIYQNQKYIVKILNIIDNNEITFEDIHTSLNYSIELNDIFELYEVKLL